MNKKLKKALYMFGFALPIVAIPIITVACGTQTSQNAPKETDKNQNEQTPKQEAPIQDQNKRVTVLSNLSSSKIYDENLLNSNVIELFKLFEEKSNLEKIKNYIEDISKNLDGLSILTTKELENNLNILETFLSSIDISKIKIIKINETIKKSKEAVKAIIKVVDALKTRVEIKPAESAKKAQAALEAASKAIEVAEAAESKTKTEAEKAADDSIKLIKQSFNEISKNATNLYKNLFLNQSSFDITSFSKLKYNDFLSKFSEVKLTNFF